jgi:hypothetical protein
MMSISDLRLECLGCAGDEARLLLQSRLVNSRGNSDKAQFPRFLVCSLRHLVLPT